MFFISKFHRFVRREKEIAESRFEIAQEETLRYRLRAENLERELKEVQDSMKSSKERMEVCVTKNWQNYNRLINIKVWNWIILEKSINRVT